MSLPRILARRPARYGSSSAETLARVARLPQAAQTDRCACIWSLRAEPLSDASIRECRFRYSPRHCLPAEEPRTLLIQTALAIPYSAFNITHLVRNQTHSRFIHCAARPERLD